jgi:hypothetical protein
MKAKKIWLGSVFLLLLVVIALVRTTPDPSYRGHRLSYWLECSQSAIEAHNDQELAKAQEAIRGIGTNALPLLHKMMLAGQRTKFELTVDKYMAKLPFMNLQLSRSEARRSLSRRLAFQGHLALRSETQRDIPFFCRILTNSASMFERVDAAGTLGLISRDSPNSSANALLAGAKDDYGHVRWTALKALRETHPDGHLVIPGLIEALDNPLQAARYEAEMALGNYGPEAKAAMPRQNSWIRSFGNDSAVLSRPCRNRLPQALTIFLTWKNRYRRLE